MEDTPNVPLRREADHKFKKRYLLVPVALLIVTVAGFSALKTSEKTTTATTTTETTATASVEIPAPATTTSGTGVNGIISKDLHGTVPAKVEATPVPAPPRLQLSLDVIKERESFHRQQQRWYAQMAFSTIMALASLYVILSKKYPDGVDKWAYSTIAFIMGFWLQGL